MVIVSVYQHPNNNIKDFGDAFVHVIKTFKTNQNYMALGDFNIHYKKPLRHQLCLIMLAVYL